MFVVFIFGLCHRYIIFINILLYPINKYAVLTGLDHQLLSSRLQTVNNIHQIKHTGADFARFQRTRPSDILI